jgi:gamma-glutamylaminecyclotransferase
VTTTERAARTRVFVYGTLLPGEANHSLLARSRSLGPARTLPAYELYDLGGYPGLVPGGVTVVLGELYEVDAATLSRLDELEEHPRFYRRTPIVLADGRTAEAYLLEASAVLGGRFIASGDWRGAGVGRR